MTDEGISRIMAALMAEPGYFALDPAHESEKSHRIKVARAAISDALFRWTGHRPDEAGRIPIVRDGKFLGHHTDDALGMETVDRLALAVLERSTTELKSQLETLRKLHAALSAFRANIPELQPETRLEIHVHEQLHKGFENRVESRVLAALGWMNSCLLAGNNLLPVLGAAIAMTEHKLVQRRAGKGRPRDEAAYAFAHALARLYARSTGKRPTFSRDADGYYGEFTPALRDAFDHVGWKSLDGRADTAISNLSEGAYDLPRSAKSPQEFALMGGIFGLDTR
jgi:hypothetical protein